MEYPISMKWEKSETVSPKVSVLMSVYNGRRFLRQAVGSILAQTMGDFEFIVIDDGSTDDTPGILADCDDPRIAVHRNDENIGLTRSLNRGLEKARGDFIARIDADDVARLDRFEKQVAYLEAHPEVGIVGSACRLIDEAGGETGLSEVPLDDLGIRWRALTANAFQHPSVMVRQELLNRLGLRYDETYATAQDYVLWRRLLKHCKGANLSEPLTLRRIHPDSVSLGSRARQNEDHIRASLEAISEVWPGHPLSGADFDALRVLLSTSRPLPGQGDGRRYGLLGIYAELLDRFCRLHEGEPGLDALVERELFAMAVLALRFPWRSGLCGLLRSLSRHRRGLAWSCLKWGLRRAFGR